MSTISSNIESLVKRYEPQSRGKLIDDFSKNPSDLIAIFRYATKDMWYNQDPWTFEKFFYSFTSLRNENKLSETQLREIIQIAARMQLHEVEWQLQEFRCSFLFNSLNASNVSDFLKDAEAAQDKPYIHICN